MKPRTLLWTTKMLLLLAAATTVLQPSDSSSAQAFAPPLATTTTATTSRRTPCSSPASSRTNSRTMIHNNSHRRKAAGDDFTSRRSKSVLLFLSDIPDDETSNSRDVASSNASSKRANSNDDNDNDNNNSISTDSVDQRWADSVARWFQSQLQTAARSIEDRFTLTGDLLAIAVYAWSDHFFGRDLARYLVRHADFAAGGGGGDPLPAWMETATGAVAADSSVIATEVWRSQLADHLVAHYSPLLQTTGGAAALLAACWIAAGCFWQTFRYSSSVGGNSDRVLVQTALTWATAAALLLSLTVASNAALLLLAVSGGGGMEQQQLLLDNNGLWPTQGDVMFAIDAWSLLTMWRFLICMLLGGGGGGGNRRD